MHCTPTIVFNLTLKNLIHDCYHINSVSVLLIICISNKYCCFVFFRQSIVNKWKEKRLYLLLADAVWDCYKGSGNTLSPLLLYNDTRFQTSLTTHSTSMRWFFFFTGAWTKGWTIKDQIFFWRQRAWLCHHTAGTMQSECTLC